MRSWEIIFERSRFKKRTKSLEVLQTSPGWWFPGRPPHPPRRVRRVPPGDKTRQCISKKTQKQTHTHTPHPDVTGYPEVTTGQETKGGMGWLCVKETYGSVFHFVTLITFPYVEEGRKKNHTTSEKIKKHHSFFFFFFLMTLSSFSLCSADWDGWTMCQATRRQSVAVDCRGSSSSVCAYRKNKPKWADCSGSGPARLVQPKVITSTSELCWRSESIIPS